MFFKPKPTPFTSPENSTQELRAIPGRNELAKVLAQEEGKYVVVEIELKYGPIISPIATLLKARRKKRIHLDGLSLDIYNKSDGYTTIEDIIESWISGYKLSYFEARSLCLYYLQHLSGNGIIALGIPKDLN